jgi:hypothetical protein
VNLLSPADRTAVGKVFPPAGLVAPLGRPSSEGHALCQLMLNAGRLRTGWPPDRNVSCLPGHRLPGSP